MPGAFYATVTLSAEHLESIAARAELVLDADMLGGTGFHTQKVPERILGPLRRDPEVIHSSAPAQPAQEMSVEECLLDTVISHYE